MAYTVNSAFETFRRKYVDLDRNDVIKARTSRDYLVEQLKALYDKDTDRPYIPKIYDRQFFGSFSRKTQIRPLDDIDIMILLSDGCATYHKHPDKPYHYQLWITSDSSFLCKFTTGNGYVNSTKVLNKLKSLLYKIPQYSESNIKRNQHAVVLNLISYTWSFDIVPAIAVQGYNSTIESYLIPGEGDWIKTDPRIDQTNITNCNKKHGGLFIQTMRLIKFWNVNGSQPKLPSYYIETLSIKVFSYFPQINSFQQAMQYFFTNCPSQLWAKCPDPKGLGPNLDANMTPDTKLKVSNAMNTCKENVDDALYYEQLGDYKTAIGCWKKVFGWRFPDYG